MRAVARPELLHGGQQLLQVRHAFLLRHAAGHAVEFILIGAAGDAEFQAPAGQVVAQRGLAGEPDRVPDTARPPPTCPAGCAGMRRQPDQGQLERVRADDRASRSRDARRSRAISNPPSSAICARCSTSRITSSIRRRGSKRSMLTATANFYSFDPALAAQYDLAGMSGVTIEVPWEDDLKPGPVGEYVEVIDVDPGSNAAYAPVDLNSPALLATDGLTPSESDPRFHQQMCYAVAMKTIEHFERALGRKALWSSHRHRRKTGAITRTMSLDCASIPTRCVSRMRSTARRRRRCSSGTSRPGQRMEEIHRAPRSSPAFRTTSLRMKRPMPCSTAYTRASASRSMRTCSPSMKPLPTLSRCSNTSRIRACCATRLHAPAATLRAKAYWDNWRSSSLWHPAAATRCAAISARR